MQSAVHNEGAHRQITQQKSLHSAENMRGKSTEYRHTVNSHSFAKWFIYTGKCNMVRKAILGLYVVRKTKVKNYTLVFTWICWYVCFIIRQGYFSFAFFSYFLPVQFFFLFVSLVSSHADMTLKTVLLFTGLNIMQKLSRQRLGEKDR